MQKLTTDYLIMHENEVDWDKLSSDKDDGFSLVEVRLFRKRINWRKYITNHPTQFNTDILEIGSKYFTKEIYDLLAGFGIATDGFIRNHPERFDFRLVIENCNISDETLMETNDYWEKLPDLEEIFKKSKYVDFSGHNFDRTKLYLKIL